MKMICPPYKPPSIIRNKTSITRRMTAAIELKFGMTWEVKQVKVDKSTAIKGNAFMTDSDDEVLKSNGHSILTTKNHLTGTDRIFEAYEQLNLNDARSCGFRKSSKRDTKLRYPNMSHMYP